MENLNEQFYSQFIQILKELIPERGELSKTLSETLNIEKMSVYRRLKGDIPFTFAEIIAIARKLSISLDNIINISSPYRKLPFSLHFQDYFNLNEMDYRMSEDYIKAIKTASKELNSEYGSAANIFPLPVIIAYPEIFRFFLMKWMYQSGDANSTILPYSEINVPERLSNLHKEYVKEIQNISYTYYIYHESAIQKLIRDIQYFKAIRLLTKEDIDLIKESLFLALNVFEKLTINGSFDNGNRIDMYISGVSFETSYAYLSSENINISMIDAYTLGAVTSLDAQVGETMKKWMQSIKRTSTIITYSEKNRIEFVEKQQKFLSEI